MKKTKIVCTIGPASNNEKTLKKMIEAGMNVARFNFSHGDYKTQEANLELVKKLRAEMKRPIATMMDTKGPEIRFRDFEGGKISVKKGDIFTVSANAITPLAADPVVGNYVSVNSGLYKEAASAGETGFVGQIVEKVNYTNSVSYRILVVSTGV